MNSNQKLVDLRRAITENLRVQRDGEPIEYINIGNALHDACSKQNHAIFARRGCGKTLLLHSSSRELGPNLKSVYLNCEDFKRHTFPNVLIEILSSLFREIERNLPGWFGKKKRSRQIVQGIISKLNDLKTDPDIEDENIRATTVAESAFSASGSAAITNASLLSATATRSKNKKDSIERSFSIRTEKLQELDSWLPELKEQVREFFKLSKSIEGIFLQIDDLYHLKRLDQPFVIDYIHRLCKDVPLYFKIATLKHVSTLYADKAGQPIGAQERHDYQPINIDYTFSDFDKTEKQNWHILQKFGEKANMTQSDIQDLFKGEGFSRLVMAGGGVPRDVLSLFLEVLSTVQQEGAGKIGKDEVRILSKANFERRIEELKQDSQGDEQDDLLRGIYIIREFCLEKKTNVFMVREQMLQQNDKWRALFYRLMDYRIIHSCANALTHKSQMGSYHAFAIDIGCYAHLRKLRNKLNEIDVSKLKAKDEMRSAPILEQQTLDNMLRSAPEDVERALLNDGEEYID